MDTQTKVTGVILAGGLARRMENQDKGLIRFKGQPLVSYAIAAMSPVADQAIINANRNLSGYQQFGLPVVSDQTDSFDGPLAGILAAMLFAESGILLVMPCDSPLVRADHLQKLLSTRAEYDADVAVAFDGERLHPVFLALTTTLKSSLHDYLQSGQRKLEHWLKQQNFVMVDFSKESNIFININSLPDLADLESQHTDLNTKATL
jgi:molybdenum cofactor guanylyltransferase